jgi:hypothetical protein
MRIRVLFRNGFGTPWARGTFEEVEQDNDSTSNDSFEEFYVYGENADRGEGVLDSNLGSIQFSDFYAKLQDGKDSRTFEDKQPYK